MSANARAVVFCRVSTKEQAGDEKESLPIQKAFNLHYAEKHGLEVVHDAWSVTESGYKQAERKQFREMVSFIKSERVGNLIVLNTERLSRNFEGMIALDELSRDFLTIHFTESGEKVDKNTAGDKRAFWAVKVAFARLYIDDLREKARRAYEAAYDKGLYAPNCPLGYRSKKYHLTLDEKEAPYIRRAFELYATGQESEWSLAEKLYAEGLRTRKGRKVSDTTLSRILNNPLYLGYVSWPFEESKYVSTPHHKGEWIQGQHEAILDRVLFDKVQAVLADKGRPHGKTKRFYVYRGIFKCGYCHHLMSPYTSKGHAYYASAHPHGGRCQQGKCYREDELTKQVEGALGRFSFPPELLGWMKEMLRAEFADKRDTSRVQRNKLEAEGKRLRTMIENAADDAFSGLFDRDIIRKKVVDYQSRLKGIRARLDALDGDKGEFIEQGIIILDLVQDIRGTFNRAEPEQRNRLLRILFKDVIVKDGEFTWRVNEPFTALYDIRLGKRAGMAGKQGFEP